MYSHFLNQEDRQNSFHNFPVSKPSLANGKDVFQGKESDGLPQKKKKKFHYCFKEKLSVLRAHPLHKEDFVSFLLQLNNYGRGNKHQDELITFKNLSGLVEWLKW